MHSDTADAIVSLLLLVASLQMHFPTHGVTYLHRDIYTFAQFPQAILSLWLCKRVCMAKSLIRISLCNLIYLVCFSSQRTNDTIASQEFSNCRKCKKSVGEIFHFDETFITVDFGFVISS